MGIKIVFMGSASFAVPTLTRLFEAGHTVTGVITQPDKPTGRGQSLQGPPIKARAFELHLQVYQPATLKSDEVRELVQALAAEMIVVVAYGKILPKWLLDTPRYGCVNLHGSLLPKYRGAAPIQWAIANGESTTGVSTMKIEEGVDTGPVYLRESTHIGSEETVLELSERLAAMGSELMLRTIDGVVDGTLTPQPQNHADATLAPILKKYHGCLDWNLPAQEIHNRVRGFNPWPGTITKFRGTTCKILKTRAGMEAPAGAEPGMLVTGRRSLGVCCGDSNILEILEIQQENRKAISGYEFANGARLQHGEKFEPIAA
ncbi:MAG: methionyl-tRNA formyltransferase [Acidobacteria bacterium]|nr:methionyl-tRNA formyltransferase [Acidobacteriota bacterium]